MPTCSFSLILPLEREQVCVFSLCFIYKYKQCYCSKCTMCLYFESSLSNTAMIEGARICILSGGEPRAPSLLQCKLEPGLLSKTSGWDHAPCPSKEALKKPQLLPGNYSYANSMLPTGSVTRSIKSSSTPQDGSSGLQTPGSG